MAIMFEKKRKKKKAAAKTMEASHDDWEKNYQIERDLEALCRAEAVKKDPERMKLCKKLAAKKIEENKRKKDEAQALIDMGLEGQDM